MQPTNKKSVSNVKIVANSVRYSINRWSHPLNHWIMTCLFLSSCVDRGCGGSVRSFPAYGEGHPVGWLWQRSVLLDDVRGSRRSRVCPSRLHPLLLRRMSRPEGVRGLRNDADDPDWQYCCIFVAICDDRYVLRTQWINNYDIVILHVSQKN